MAIGTVTLRKGALMFGGSNYRVDVVSFPGDGAYPTGGTTGFQALMQPALKTGGAEILSVQPQDCGGYVAAYNVITDTLKVYYGNNDGGTDGPLVEVPNNTDLSGVVFQLALITQ